MRESGFFALLAFVGYVLHLRMVGRNNLAFGATIAVPLGILLWVMVAVICLIAGLDHKYAIFVMLMLSSYLIGTAWYRSSNVSWLFPSVLVGLAALGVSFISAKMGWIQLSYDSVEQIAFGRTLIQEGLRSQSSLLASWGVLLPIIQGTSVTLRVDLITALQPLIAISLLGMLGVTVWSIFPRVSLFYTAVAVLLILTSNFFVFQAAYVHNSLISAMFLLIFFASLALALKNNVSGFLDLAFWGLLGFSICRTEAPLFATVLLILSSSVLEDGVLWPRFRKLTIFYTVIIISWEVFLMMIIGSSSDIMTPGRLAIIIGFLFFGAVLSVSRVNKNLSKLRLWSPYLMMVGCCIALFFGYSQNPEHTIDNFYSIFTNLSQTGRWGFTWWAIVFSAPLALFLTSGRKVSAFSAFVITFITLVILLGFGRVPYRLGWGDSANRMFTHLLPVITLGIMAVLTTTRWTLYPCKTHENGAPVLSFVKFAIIGFIATTCIFIPIKLLYLQPANAASHIRVLHEEGFCPPDTYGNYSFGVALNPRSATSYAAACSTGARTVELELSRIRHIREIDLYEYSADQAWKDFSIRTSLDGIKWVTVFDSKQPDNFNQLAHILSTQWRIHIQNIEPIRFIVLDYRASLGQNRLLLRQMKVLY